MSPILHKLALGPETPTSWKCRKSLTIHGIFSMKRFILVVMQRMVGKSRTPYPTWLAGVLFLRFSSEESTWEALMVRSVLVQRSVTTRIFVNSCSILTPCFLFSFMGKMQILLTHMKMASWLNFWTSVWRTIFEYHFSANLVLTVEVTKALQCNPRLSFSQNLSLVFVLKYKLF